MKPPPRPALRRDLRGDLGKFTMAPMSNTALKVGTTTDADDQPAQMADSTWRSAPWFWPVLLALTVVGLVVRILFVTLAHFQRIANDADFFRSTAHNLVSGSGYAYPFPTDPTKAVATAAHPPLFSLVIAGFDLVGIESVTAQRVALAIVTSSAVLVMGLVGRRVLNPTVGIVAAVIAALHPLWLQTIGSLMSESIYLVAVPLVILAALRAMERPTGWRFVVVGLTIAVATLVRSEAIILVVLLGVPLVLFCASGWKTALRVSGALLAGVVVLVGPWVLRNEIQLSTGSLSTQEGLTLVGSYNTNAFSPHNVYFGNFDGVTADSTAAVVIKYTKPPGGARQWNEVSLDHQLTHLGVQFARQHLSQLPRVVLAREVSTWGLTGRGLQQTAAIYGGRSAVWEQIGAVVYWVLAVFALLGAIVLGARSWKRLIVLLAPVAAVVINVAITYGSTRFRVMAEPSLAVLAAVGIVTAASWALSRHAPKLIS